MRRKQSFEGVASLLTLSIAAIAMPWAAQAESKPTCTLPAEAIVADSAATLYLAIGVHSQVKNNGGNLLDNEVLAPYFADGRLGLNAHDETVTRHSANGALAVITDDVGVQYTVLSAQLVCE